MSPEQKLVADFMSLRKHKVKSTPQGYIDPLARFANIINLQRQLTSFKRVESTRPYPVHRIAEELTELLFMVYEIACVHGLDMDECLRHLQAAKMTGNDFDLSTVVKEGEW